VRTSSRGITQW